MSFSASSVAQDEILLGQRPCVHQLCTSIVAELRTSSVKPSDPTAVSQTRSHFDARLTSLVQAIQLLRSVVGGVDPHIDPAKEGRTKTAVCKESKRTSQQKSRVHQSSICEHTKTVMRYRSGRR